MKIKHVLINGFNLFMAWWGTMWGSGYLFFPPSYTKSLGDIYGVAVRKEK